MYEQASETQTSPIPVPWNKGKLTGQKPPFTLKQIWAIRIRLQIGGRIRDLALFNLAIDSKLTVGSDDEDQCFVSPRATSHNLAPQTGKRAS